MEWSREENPNLLKYLFERPCQAKYQHCARAVGGEILFNILRQYGTLVLHFIRRAATEDEAAEEEDERRISQRRY